MLTQFDPKVVEKDVNALWATQCFFENTIDPNRKNFSIPLPPPNVTGTLHLGHAFQHTLMDILIRFHKMRGFNVHWQGGTDHAGIATQLVVLRDLKQKNIDVNTLSREEFVNHVQRWREFSENEINAQMQRLDLFIDSSKNRFTMDEKYCAIVQNAFFELYNAGLIYRGLKLVNWDPSLKSAISDLEVNQKEISHSMWTLKYQVCDDPLAAIFVSTTRPETVFGDVAIAVHPQDPRYSMLVGKKVWVPLSKRKIPIIADDSVDKVFGTGAVKITPAHDFFDEKIAKKHHLPYIQLLSDAALFLEKPICYSFTGSPLDEECPTIPYKIVNLSVTESRTIVVDLLRESEDLVAEKPHTSFVPIGDRTNIVIEPHLTWQWFLKTEELAHQAKKIVETDEILFVPKKYKNLYFSWMNHIEDWCISRQLICGHPIPVWFDTKGTAYLGECEDSIRSTYNISKSEPISKCNDVLDTWFASALWTFASLDGAQDSEEAFKAFHPFSVLVTGFDIIFFWVARMIMLTLKIKKELPFKTVFFTGLVRDELGQKMSKSRGNVVDPIDMIDGISLEKLSEKRVAHLLTKDSSVKKNEILKRTQKAFPNGIDAFGSDALRFTFAALATQGRDLHWDVPRLAGYKNFCNKLWNATRFVCEQMKNFSLKNDQKVSYTRCRPQLENNILHVWMTEIESLFLKEYVLAIERYRFDVAAQSFYEFFWHKFCDKFLELAKAESSDTNVDISEEACLSLWLHLEQLLRVAHPIMPKLTEYLWQNLKNVSPQGFELPESIVLSKFPDVLDEKLEDKFLSSESQSIEWLHQFIFEVRKFRREHQLTHTTALAIRLKPQNNLVKNASKLQRLSKNLLKNCTWSFYSDEDHSSELKKVKGENVEFFVFLSPEIKFLLNARHQEILIVLQKDQERLGLKLAHLLSTGKAADTYLNKIEKDLNDVSKKIEELQKQYC